MDFELPDELMFLKNRKLPQQQSSDLMAGKVVVITGATSGVGLAAVKRLAQGKAKLVMVSRSPQKLDQLQQQLWTLYGAEAEILVADLSDLESVREAAAKLLAAHPKIHVLINCAGMHSTRATHTREGYETVFCVNHLAPFLLTNLLLERLKDSAPARILMINSEGHRFNGLDMDDLHWQKRIYTGLRGYGASKTAQLLTLWEMNDELAGTGVTINAMHPGDVKTNIGMNNGGLYRFFNRRIISPFLKDPAVSGESIYYLVADESMNGVSGKFFHLTVEEKPASHALDRETGQALYRISRQLTGLN